jgi:hypothetical protein
MCLLLKMYWLALAVTIPKSCVIWNWNCALLHSHGQTNQGVINLRPGIRLLLQP